jgi:hypothetical protein
MGERPYFAFESDLHAVPDKPTHCRRCGTELERLRRYAGFCGGCIAKHAQPVAAPTEPLRCRFEVVRTLYRTRPGHRERYVELRCECGRRRVLKWATWVHKPPMRCNQCRLKDIDQKGFEAEYAR